MKTEKVLVLCSVDPNLTDDIRPPSLHNENRTYDARTELNYSIARAQSAVTRAKQAAEESAALSTVRRMSLNDSAADTTVTSSKATDDANRPPNSSRSHHPSISGDSRQSQSQGPLLRLTEAALLKHRQRVEPTHSWRRRGSGRFDAAALPFHCSSEYSLAQ